jgi:hypothetical protein
VAIVIIFTNRIIPRASRRGDFVKRLLNSVYFSGAFFPDVLYWRCFFFGVLKIYADRFCTLELEMLPQLEQHASGSHSVRSVYFIILYRR